MFVSKQDGMECYEIWRGMLLHGEGILVVFIKIHGKNYLVHSTIISINMVVACITFN